MITATKLRKHESSLCRHEAYQYFLEQLPVLHTTDGLVRAAIAISMHALDDIDPHRIAIDDLERSPRSAPRSAPGWRQSAATWAMSQPRESW